MNRRSLSSLTVNFSSGPCAKRKDWQMPSNRLFGRSHRSVDGLARIQEVIALMRKILIVPDDYLIGIVSGSDTGAMETLMWNLLGARGVDVLASCTFGRAWAHDVTEELKISDSRVFYSDFPNLCDTSEVDFSRDVVFCQTSTTSGASFRNADWIRTNREGLTLCDATSAVFTCDIDWSKLDATAFSWQKGLGGEAGLGTIVLSPRAVSRLESYRPTWPIPRIFRIVSDKKINFKIFDGYLINTPSMMCFEDFYDALQWADTIGGLPKLIERVERNYDFVRKWVANQDLFRFLVRESQRAHHICCLDINDRRYQELSVGKKWDFLRRIVTTCEQEGSGYDFLGHIATEPHLRFWMGPTIDVDDVEHVLAHVEQACKKVLSDTTY